MGDTRNAYAFAVSVGKSGSNTRSWGDVGLDYKIILKRI